MTHRFDASRRRFLTKAAALSAAGPAAPFALNLAAVGEAAAQTSSCTDYKALVCIFLTGGNDHFNTVLATDPDSWSAYRATRNIAPAPIALDDAGFATGVLPIAPITAVPGRSFALHPELSRLRQMFDVDRRAAIVANVGPLIRPTTLTQYRNASHPRPKNVFSHIDQASIWQSFAPEGASEGWGGRMIDLLSGCNTGSSFASISTGARAVWLSGRTIRQYQVSYQGVYKLAGSTGTLYGSTTASTALREIVSGARTHPIRGEVSAVNARSLANSDALSTALASGPAASIAQPTQFSMVLDPGYTVYSNLSQQLRVVAQMIAARDTLGLRRQVFMVQLDGFDLHDGQNARHHRLLAELSHAIKYFQDQMTTLGLADKVTTFTASDFGRALSSNGDGTDHGWGGHHFVVGGAVRGGEIYGAFPTIGLRTSTDVGRGALLPSIAVDQYAGMLGRWFGVPDSALADVFPNLPNFASGGDRGLPASLAFMA